MKTPLQILLNKTEKQTKLWKYLAWSAPFAGLASLVVSYLIGGDNLIDVLVTGIIVTFFTVGVFWWWWAIDKIYQLVQAFNRTDESFEKVVDELQKIRSDLKDTD